MRSLTAEAFYCCGEQLNASITVQLCIGRANRAVGCLQHDIFIPTCVYVANWAVCVVCVQPPDIDVLAALVELDAAGNSGR